MNNEIKKYFRYNFIVNVMDGGFFGAGIGFASFITILPLFVSTMTDSAILIGLVPAIHTVGWQLPQLLTVNRVARLSRYKPMVLLMSLNERLPFFGLALVAWFLPTIGVKVALPLTFSLLVWEGFGGGFTATAWQSMIHKIFTSKHLGSFFGIQAAVGSLFGAVGAIMAGIILEQKGFIIGFTVIFFLAGILCIISWLFISLTHEPENLAAGKDIDQTISWSTLWDILGHNANFRWFLTARIFSQLAIMAFPFYVIYAIQRYNINEWYVGILTGLFMITQFFTGPFMGWFGDRHGHNLIFKIGMFAAAVSALLAWLAPNASWFYLVFILIGIANVSSWTTLNAMTLEFGNDASKPAYVGLANSIVAPVTLIAPFLGGWLANIAGYPATFVVAAFGGIITILILHFFVSDPRHNLYRLEIELQGDAA